MFPYLKRAYVRATEFAAPATMRLSARGGGQLPVSTVATLADAARSSGGRAVVARPAQQLHRGVMRGVPASQPLSDSADGDFTGPVTVAELPGGRVLGPHRAVISGTGELVDEVSRYFGTTGPRQHPLFWNPFPAPPRQVPGRLGVLAIRGDGNYYHFLCDALPRIATIEQGPDLPGPDRWYVPAGQSFQRELLDMLGISAATRIDADEHPHVQAETLIVPALAAMSEKNPPWVVEFLRARVLPLVDDDPSTRTPVYVTRGRSVNNRSVVNDAAVRSLLRDRGFVVVDAGQLTVAEQIRTFASASVIVAAHGAALANLVFASPGTTVIELFPAGCLLPDYWRLASGVPGLRYRYLSASDPREPFSRGAAIVRDITVDLRGLSALLDSAGEA
jgi:capsular polysaccharide biosynthesis protein